MVTEISGAGPSHSVVSQLGTTHVQRVAGTIYPETGVSPRVDGPQDKQLATSTQLAGSYAQLRGRQDMLNKAASVMREISDRVEQNNQLQDKMESELGEILKIYPPYPIDSPERISLLNNIDSLRKQVDALTYPPPEEVDAALSLIGSKQDAAKQGGDVSVGLSFIVAAKGHNSDFPALKPESASDEEVGKALEQVKATQSSLREFKMGMWQDVVSFVKQAVTFEVQNEASDVREQIANLGGRGIGGNAHQFVQAVELK